MAPNIHILGIQGSGKGTQSSLLVEKFNFLYASSGQLFRERIKVSDALGEKIRSIVAAGKLIPDDLLFETVEAFLEESQENTSLMNGFLGDGVIRTVNQYYGLQPIWKNHNLEEALLVHLELPESIATERIQHRADSGTEERPDDHPEAIQKRFALFNQMTLPVIDLFEASGRCIHIKADQSIEAIHEQICEKLVTFYPELSHVTA